MGDFSGLQPSAGRKRPGDDLPDDCKLYVGGLPPVYDENMLRSMFEPFGAVLHSAVVSDGVGNSRGFGFIHMCDANATRNARMALDHKVTMHVHPSVKGRDPDSSHLTNEGCVIAAGDRRSQHCCAAAWR
jgi:splicing factor 1